VRVAVRRAKCGVMLARKLRGKGAHDGGEEGGARQGQDGVAGMVEDIRQLRSQQRKRRRRKGGNDADDNAKDGDERDDANSNLQPAPVSQTELLAHLGRTAMNVDVPSSSTTALSSTSSTSLRVEWSVQFDGTGEAKSQIGLLVGVPGKCRSHRTLRIIMLIANVHTGRKADTRGRLATLPKLFDQLVQDSGDPMVAVQTVVALLAGEGQ
jgi:hypothetical protein